ncbi:HemD Uroporphyrinogen-III synthase [Paracoccaceae bacterium]
MAKQSTATATPVLLTRPEARSLAFAAALDVHFGDRLRCVMAPLMAPRILSPSLPEGHFDAVIFTSATAVEAARKLGVPLPTRAFCVGARTAVAARAAGFVASSAGGDAGDLVAAILSDPARGRLLHLRGQDSTGDVAERLTAHGITTIPVIVYGQDPQPLTSEATGLLQDPAPLILPIFSPRSAALLSAALPETTRARLHIAAMSAAVAKAAFVMPNDVLVIARQPDAEGMLEAVGTLLADLPPP